MTAPAARTEPSAHRSPEGPSRPRLRTALRRRLGRALGDRSTDRAPRTLPYREFVRR